jgi:hypothetical protein
MLHHMITKENLQISNIQEIDQAALQDTCRKCRIKTSRKSKVKYTLIRIHMYYIAITQACEL